MTMRCWVALPVLVASGITFHEVVAQEAGSVPAAVQARVRAMVGERWSVAAEELVLEWGARGRTALDPQGDIELLGSGRGGHWVVRVTRRTGGTESVRVQAGVRVPVTVAARELERGEVLDASDIARDDRIRWGPPGRTPPTTEVEGWVTHRAMHAGEELRVPAVRPPLAVVSGQPIELVWARDGVGLSVQGRAAQSAALGDTVFVRTESGERLRGVVVAPGRVNVTQGGDA